MNLEVNEYYLNASGEIVKIIEFNRVDRLYFSENNSYFEDGLYYSDEKHRKDLIAEVPKELHWWILYNIKNFHTNRNVRKKLRRKYTNHVNCCLKKGE